MMGQWRVEVTPSEPRKEDVFLHVIQVGDRQLAAMDQTTLIEEQGRYGVRLVAGEETWEVLFDATGQIGGHIRRTGATKAIDQPLTHSVAPQSGLMLRPKAPRTTDH
jgi:hypothetical protein